MADIRRMLNLSTGHVSTETRDFLNADGEKSGLFYRTHSERGSSPRFHMAAHTYGWILWVYDEDSEWREGVPEGVCACLAPIFRLAKANGCEWINFDCDASLDPSLTKFDW